MDGWHIWIIIALVFVVIEVFTSGFAVMCISFGCLFGAGASALGLDIKWQLLLFAVGTALAFATIRPFVNRFLFKKVNEVKTNTDALIGRKAVVLQSIKGEMHPGRVKVDGDDWKAIACDDQLIEEGDIVEIISINSVILTVKKI